MFMAKKTLTGFALLLSGMLLLGCSASGESHVEKVQDPPYELASVSQLSEGMMAVADPADLANPKYGYTDHAGKLVIPFSYEVTQPFQDGLAAVYLTKDPQRLVYIDKTGQEVISQVDGKNIEIGDSFLDGYASVQLQDTEGSYIIDKNGDIKLSSAENGYYYSNLGGGFFERYLTKNCADPQGMVDASGTVVYSGPHMIACPSSSFSGFYTDSPDFIFGLWDNQTLQPIGEKVYTQVIEFENNRALVETTDGRVQLIDGRGNCILDLSAQYEPISAFSHGIAICSKNGAFGYIDKTGTEIAEPIYEMATHVENGNGFLFRNGVLYRLKL